MYLFVIACSNSTIKNWQHIYYSKNPLNTAVIQLKEIGWWKALRMHIKVDLIYMEDLEKKSMVVEKKRFISCDMLLLNRFFSEP